MENARRWSGYVCPDCRFVFRVPRDHDGKGVVCPSCRRLLKIPTAQETPPPLMARQRQTLPVAGSSDGSLPPLVKRRRRKKVEKDHSWEHEAGSARSKRAEKRQMNLMLLGGATLFALIVGWVLVSMNAGPKAGGSSGPASASAAPAAVLESGDPPQTAAGDKEALAEAEALAKIFLNATAVEEILPLVRDPLVAEPRIRKFHADGKIDPSGISSFNVDGGGWSLGKVASIMIRTRDHEDRTLSFVKTPEGLKIDWESWVGWSEMPWEEFLSSKPGTPHLFRVRLSAVEYYNFEFGDDSKWQSFRLESPDKEHAIYGYAPKASVLAAKLRPMEGSKPSSLMLTLKFPQVSSSSTQVEIEDLIGEGWVEGSDEP
jgi:hypothetical protein